MQQFLIPSSTGSSQIINIPVSLLSQANQQPISFITANGQIFQIPSFPQLVVQQNNGETSSTGNANQNGSASASTSSTPSTTTNQSSQQQTLVINHQGQLLSLPVLQAAATSTGSTTAQITNASTTQATTTPQIQTVSVNSTQNQNSNNLLQAVNLSQIQFAALTQNNAQNNSTTTQRLTTSSNTTSGGGSNTNQNGTTPIKTLLEEDDKSDSIDDQGPTIANIPTMPSTHQLTHATTVDGVNLDEIREFAKAFKLRRLALGLTQTQVGQALSATKGPAYSQSAICRFEKLDITPKSAAKIKPVLEKWMQEAELKYADRLKSGTHTNFADLLGTENTKKRKRRTSFTPQALEILNDYFEKNSHPSSNQGADMTMLAQKLNYDREVIRVWFCNKRQALKNTMKKLKSEGCDTNSDGSLSPNSSSNSISQTLSNQLIQQQQQQQQQQQSVVIVNANQQVLDQAHIQELAQLATQQTQVNISASLNSTPVGTPTKTVITLTNTKLEPQIQTNPEQSVIQATNSDEQQESQQQQVQTVVVTSDLTTANNSQENNS